MRVSRLSLSRFFLEIEIKLPWRDTDKYILRGGDDLRNFKLSYLKIKNQSIDRLKPILKEKIADMWLMRKISLNLTNGQLCPRGRLTVANINRV